MVKIEKQNEVYIVRFENTNRLNTLNADSIKSDINSTFSNPGTRMILDLEGIDFIDSTGFGVLLSVMKTAHQNQGQFKISGISESVMELFKLLHLHHVFEIYATTGEAMKSFG